MSPSWWYCHWSSPRSWSSDCRFSPTRGRNWCWLRFNRHWHFRHSKWITLLYCKRLIRLQESIQETIAIIFLSTWSSPKCIQMTGLIITSPAVFHVPSAPSVDNNSAQHGNANEVANALVLLPVSHILDQILNYDGTPSAPCRPTSSLHNTEQLIS